MAIAAQSRSSVACATLPFLDGTSLSMAAGNSGQACVLRVYQASFWILIEGLI